MPSGLLYNLAHHLTSQPTQRSTTAGLEYYNLTSLMSSGVMTVDAGLALICVLLGSELVCKCCATALHVLSLSERPRLAQVSTAAVYLHAAHPVSRRRTLLSMS